MAETTRTAPLPPGPPDPPPPADVPMPPYVAALQAALPGSIQHVAWWVGDWTLVVDPSRLLDVARHLRDSADASFTFCSDLTASDWPARTPRFDVVYALYSIALRHRLRLKVRVADGEPVSSVSGVWPSSVWLEREVFDLFGIRFEGHPDLRRILMPDAWQGYPQRKDYPLEGPGELLIEDPTAWIKLRRGAEDME